MKSHNTTTPARLSLIVALLACCAADAQEAPKPAAPTLRQALEAAAALTADSTAQDETVVAAPAPEPLVALTAPEIEGDVITSWPIRGADIRPVLRLLAMQSRRNIVVSPRVSGAVSADLYDVTINEALEALLTVNGFDYMEQGDFIYVYTAAEMEKIRKDKRQLMTRVYHLHYLKPKDASDLVAPCLSDDGEIATTPDAASGIAASKDDAGGMSYAINDMLVVSDYEENLDRVGQMLEQADRQPQQVLIEATIMSAQLGEDNQLGINFSAIDGVSLAGNPFQLAFGQATSMIANDGLVFRWDGQDVDTLIEALESVTDVNVLANPKLMVLNKQRGEIIVGREQGYLGRIVFNDDGTRTQETETMETGTRMRVRPYIGDNGYIRLEIHPEDSSGLIAADTGLPDKRTSECTTNIMVRDGHTIIISGMFRESTTTERTQVPVLGNIPLLGVLFRDTRDSVAREELVILLTPRIVNTVPDEQLSDELAYEAERFRLSMRNNLQWFGRNRMAVRHFNWARELAARGHDTLAMLDVRQALVNNPAMDEALDLREELTGRALQDDEPVVSSVRYVIARMMANEAGLSMPAPTDLPALMAPTSPAVPLPEPETLPAPESPEAPEAPTAPEQTPGVPEQAHASGADAAISPADAGVSVMDAAAAAAKAAGDAAAAAAALLPKTATVKLPEVDMKAPPALTAPAAAPDAALNTSPNAAMDAATADMNAGPAASPLASATPAGSEPAAPSADAPGLGETLSRLMSRTADALAASSTPQWPDLSANLKVEPLEAAKTIDTPATAQAVEAARTVDAAPRPLMDRSDAGDAEGRLAAARSAAGTDDEVERVAGGDQPDPASQSAYYVRPETGVRPLFDMPR